MHVPIGLVTIFTSAPLGAVTSYVISRVNQQNQRSIESGTYRQALLIEVRALHDRLLDCEVAYETHVMTKQISSAQRLKIVPQPGDYVLSRTQDKICSSKSTIMPLHIYKTSYLMIMLQNILIITATKPTRRWRSWYIQRAPVDQRNFQKLLRTL
jgi:hypothetical protein